MHRKVRFFRNLKSKGSKLKPSGRPRSPKHKGSKYPSRSELQLLLRHKLNNCKYQFEVRMSYLHLWLYTEYETAMLLFDEGCRVPLALKYFGPSWSGSKAPSRARYPESPKPLKSGICLKSYRGSPIWLEACVLELWGFGLWGGWCAWLLRQPWNLAIRAQIPELQGLMGVLHPHRCGSKYSQSRSYSCTSGPKVGIHIYIYIHIHLLIHLSYRYIYACIIYIYMFVVMYVFPICTYMPKIHVCIHTYLYIYIYIYVCVSIYKHNCMCVYIYIYIYLWFRALIHP